MEGNVITPRSRVRRAKGESRAEEVFAKMLTIQRAIQSGMQAMDGSVGMSGSISGGTTWPFMRGKVLYALPARMPATNPPLNTM